MRVAGLEVRTVLLVILVSLDNSSRNYEPYQPTSGHARLLATERKIPEDQNP